MKKPTSEGSVPSTSLAEKLYAEALQSFKDGHIHSARSLAEQVLECCAEGIEGHDGEGTPSPARGEEGTCSAQQNHSNEYTIYDGENRCYHPPAHPAPGQKSASASPTSAVRMHTLFTDALVLLSNVCSAEGYYAEAERLLVTCMGYIRDSFETQEEAREKAVTCKGSRNRRESLEGCSLARSSSLSSSRPLVAMRNMALATILYNRAVLVLDEYQFWTVSHRTASTQSSSVERNKSDTSLSSPAEQNTDVLIGRLMEARDDWLPDAERRLENCLGDSRRLLADVWHSSGVCHHILGDAVAALGYYQRSMELRLCFFSSNTSSSGAGFSLPQDRGSTPTTTSEVETALKIVLTLEHVVQLYDQMTKTNKGGTDHLHLLDPHILQRALETVSRTRKNALGPRHPMTARALFLEGVFAAEHGRVKTARRCLEQCKREAEEVEEELSLGGPTLPCPSEDVVNAWLEVLR